MLSAILWTPLAFGLISLLAPRRFAPWVAGTGTLITLVLAAIVAIGFDSSQGLQYVVDVTWIPGLGINYSLGIDGISVFLVLLTALAWVPAVAFTSSAPPWAQTGSAARRRRADIQPCTAIVATWSHWPQRKTNRTCPAQAQCDCHN